eukprot:4404751-Amphidinium_carterae.1
MTVGCLRSNKIQRAWTVFLVEDFHCKHTVTGSIGVAPHCSHACRSKLLGVENPDRFQAWQSRPAISQKVGAHQILEFCHDDHGGGVVEGLKNTASSENATT